MSKNCQAREIPPHIAEEIKTILANMLQEDIHIIDARGIIISSTRAGRLGTWHEAAARLIRGEIASCAVTEEDVPGLQGVQQGYGQLLKVDDEILGVVVITGEPERVKPYGELAAEFASLWLKIYFIENTEKNRAAMQERENFFQLVERANDGITIIQDFNIKYANHKLSCMLGYSPESVIDTPFFHYLHPGEVEKVKQNYQRRMAGEDIPPVYETVLVRRDGESLPVELNAGQITYQGRPANLVIARDITERKKSQQALQESRQRFLDVINFLPDAAFAIDLEGKVFLWNRAAEELLGIPAEDMVGRGDYAYAVPFYGERRPILIDLVLEQDPEVEEKYRFIKRMPDKSLVGEAFCPCVGESGAILWAKASLLYNLQGEVVGAIETLRDITEKQRSEEALLQAYERARQLEQVKTDFLSTVSHELRTPLTSVLGFARIIQKRFLEVISPTLPGEDRKVQRAARQLKDNIDIIVSEGERLTALINDVLDIAKMEAGRMEWKMDYYCIQEVVERAIAVTGCLLEGKGLSLHRQVDPGLPRLKGDRDRLIQVVVNLLSNAVKFTQEGSISCRVSRGEHEIVVSVVDSGIGIQEEDQAKVFEKFKQVGDTLSGKPGGTGLGLPICKQIVEMHGGRIWVESQPGRGSSFSFTLPLGQDWEGHGRDSELDLESLLEQLEDWVAPGEKEVPPGEKHILIADDETSIRQFLRQEMEGAGYRVTEAKDGMEVLRLVKEEKPDLILMDVMMPRMTGLEAVAVLKNDPATAAIPIIVLSVLEDQEKGLKSGVDRYFTKPVDTPGLLIEIEHLLSRGGSSKKVLVIDQDANMVKTLTAVMEARGFTVVSASSGQEGISRALEESPDMIVVDGLYSEKEGIARAIKFEKGLENILLVLLGKKAKG